MEKKPTLLDAAKAARHALKSYAFGNSSPVLASQVSETLDRVLEEEGKTPYLIWSNEHGAWWRPSQWGYTRDVTAAGRYPRAVAMQVCATARAGWLPGMTPPEIAIPEIDVLEALGEVPPS